MLLDAVEGLLFFVFRQRLLRSLVQWFCTFLLNDATVCGKALVRDKRLISAFALLEEGVSCARRLVGKCASRFFPSLPHPCHILPLLLLMLRGVLAASSFVEGGLVGPTSWIVGYLVGVICRSVD